MSVPYTLVIIKPMTVGRGDAPDILHRMLDSYPLTLVKFRSWFICDTTLLALSADVGNHAATFNYEEERIHAQRTTESWVCIFTHRDRQTDPTDQINAMFGPLDPDKVLPTHMRYQYGGLKKVGTTAHPSDTVVHIAAVERRGYEANLLFLEFDETLL